MRSILMLVHRIPFPPNKGDKIRAYHLLTYLARHASVYLGTFIDDPYDWRYVNDIKSICKEVFVLPLPKQHGAVRSVSGLLRNEALSVRYYNDKRMRKWVDRIIAGKNIDSVVAYSSTMAQFIDKKHNIGVRVADFVDVDSDKWLQYAKNKPWPMSWIYRREGRKLFEYERAVTDKFDATFFVSAAEADMFKAQVPRLADKVDYYYNGVDTDYFDPDATLDNPYKPDEQPIVFTGAMDYFANSDAVQWFATHVMPGVWQQRPDAVFYIVGANPASAVKRLEKQPGIRVTGRVPDVRGYLRYARVVVAPIRIARGIQNKVLEALAMAKPVIASDMAVAGIGDPGREWLTVAVSPGAWIESVVKALSVENNQNISDARNWVCNRFNWQDNLDRLGGRIFPADQPRQ